MKKRITIAFSLFIGLAALFLIGRSLLYYSPGHVFFRQYNQLQPGMTFSQVQAVFGRSPDYVCGFNNGRIAYYARGCFPEKKLNPQLLPTSVQATNKIPYIYGSGQCLFNSHGVLSAYTCCGEELNIHTSKGGFHGSDLSQISNSMLNQLSD
ncbi:MAG: hypothetical protein A2107_14305 [Verrucomicrobia bacterium GWF2_62_7]|nr:MAG: hypothetical protein A2107_14305 [Verrucomicrobia bacterium GWF2_62_7]